MVNAGKDVRGDFMELIAYGAPGGFVFTQAIMLDFYLRGGNTFINEEKVRNILQLYIACFVF